MTRGEKGYIWDDFLDRVRKLRPNQIWRHNQAGDLPGTGNEIHPLMLVQLVNANEGRRGFTYTHYPMTPGNDRLVQLANEGGFTINLSADTLEEADQLASLGVGPVVTLLPPGQEPRETPGGRKITRCPAQSVEYMTCAVCQLCQDPKRETIVGFVAHGARRKAVNRIIEIKQEKNYE